jgi:hypothetical protein
MRDCCGLSHADYPTNIIRYYARIGVFECKLHCNLHNEPFDFQKIKSNLFKMWIFEYKFKDRLQFSMNYDKKLKCFDCCEGVSYVGGPFHPSFQDRNNSISFRSIRHAWALFNGNFIIFSYYENCITSRFKLYEHRSYIAGLSEAHDCDSSPYLDYVCFGNYIMPLPYFDRYDRMLLWKLVVTTHMFELSVNCMLIHVLIFL